MSILKVTDDAIIKKSPDFWEKPVMPFSKSAMVIRFGQQEDSKAHIKFRLIIASSRNFGKML